MPRPLALLLTLFLPALALRADAPAMAAAPQPYASASQVDLTRLLAPPPDAKQARQELDELLRIQKSRTAADEAACVGDQVISVFRFADVLGGGFTPENLPKTNALFLRVVASVHVPLAKAQDHWTRKRPPLVEPAIKPVGQVPATAAYPSGHATNGNLMAILLADMVPEKAAALRARGALFAERRVLAGVHYPSDIEAGAQSAPAIAQALFQDPQFVADYAGAEEELRKSLDLEAGEYHGAKGQAADGDVEAKEAKEY
jgi:acid phosphatase (class A)